MSISLGVTLWVRVEQSERVPAPMPLESGFDKGMAYKVLGCYSPSESGEAWMILCNDREEIWFISNRHLRVVYPYRGMVSAATRRKLLDFSLACK